MRRCLFPVTVGGAPTGGRDLPGLLKESNLLMFVGEVEFGCLVVAVFMKFFSLVKFVMFAA